MSEEIKREQGEISRRTFLKDATLIAGSAAISSSLALAGSAQTVSAQAATPVTLEIFDPKGPTEVTAVYNKRLDTLEGKRIGYTEGTWMVGTAKPLVMDLLKKQYPTMQVVDKVPEYPTFQAMKDEDVAKWMKDNKVDGMIVGNAG